MLMTRFASRPIHPQQPFPVPVGAALLPDAPFRNLPTRPLFACIAVASSHVGEDLVAFNQMLVGALIRFSRLYPKSTGTRRSPSPFYG